MLIALIFIKKAVENLVKIGQDYPVHEGPCFCSPANGTLRDEFGTSEVFSTGNDNATGTPGEFPCNVSTESIVIL